MNLRITSAAEREFAEATLYYLEASPRVAQKITDEMEAALTEIAANPLRYPLKGRVSRIKPLAVYPFNIVYRLHEETIEILSIHHQARIPKRWQDRE